MAQVFNVIGDVKDRDVVLFDDMVDTAGTLVLSAAALQKNGARRILAACTHPVLSGQAIEKIESSPLEELFVSDTIPLDRPGPRPPEDRRTVRGRAVRRSHPPDQRGQLRELAVSLRRSSMSLMIKAEKRDIFGKNAARRD